MARLQEAWRHDIARSARTSLDLAEQTRRDTRDSVKELKRRLERTRRRLDANLRHTAEQERSIESLHARLGRLELTAIADARETDRLAAWNAGASVRGVEEHVRQAVAAAILRETPMAHLVVEDLFPSDFYELLLSSLPSPDFFPQHNGMPSHLRPAQFDIVPRLTRLLWQYVDRVLAMTIEQSARQRLGTFIEARYRDLFGERASKVMNLPHGPFGGQLTLRRSTSVEKPRVLPKRASAAVFIHLTRPGDTSAGGMALYEVMPPVRPFRTTSYCPEEYGVACTEVSRVAGHPNSALILLNGGGAYAPYPDQPQMTAGMYRFEYFIGPVRPELLRVVSRLPRSEQQPWIGLMAAGDDD